MLSILPFERLASASSSAPPTSSSRDADRPFKAYPNPHPTSLYSNYTHSSLFGSVLPSTTSSSSPPSASPHGMDLRASTTSQYDAGATAHHIKQEMENYSAAAAASHHGSYSHPHAHHPYNSYNGYAAMAAHHTGYNMNSGSHGSSLMSGSGSMPLMHSGLGSNSSTTNGGTHAMNGITSNGLSEHGLNSPPSNGQSTDDNKPSLHNVSSGSSPTNTHNSSDSASPSHSKKSSRKVTTARVPEDMKDNAYWEKRKKNNESAKRSREARRQKEEQIAMRVVYLEQENLQLRTEVGLLKGEIEKLRGMLYHS